MDTAQSAAERMATIEGPQDPDRQGMDPLALTELMDHFGVPGVSVAVVDDFEIHWAKGYGTAGVGTGAPVTTETLFQAASISKPVAAMAVLRAVQDGHFEMDDDINTILKSWQLPESPFTAGRVVTPTMLTSHTAGLGDGFGFPGYHPSDPLPTTVQILDGEGPANVGPVFFERPPLTAQKYSGGGVTIMQLALTDALGRPFDGILEEYVLGPLAMNDSTFAQPLSPAREENAARAHDGQGQVMDPRWHVYPELAAAGLWTTPTDLAKFVIEVQKSLRGEANKVLSRPMIKEMLSPVGVGGFAVGFRISEVGEGWYFSHSGGNWGYKCNLIAHKVKGYGAAIMTNADNGDRVMLEIKERLEHAYGWDSVDKPVLHGRSVQRPAPRRSQRTPM